MALLTSVHRMRALLADSFNVVAFWRDGHPAELWGKTVVIADGASETGLALARAFAAEGCNVALCDPSVVDLKRAHHELALQNASVFTAACDATDCQQVKGFINHVREQFGGVDVLLTHADACGFSPDVLSYLEREGLSVTLLVPGLRPIHSSRWVRNELPSLAQLVTWATRVGQSWLSPGADQSAQAVVQTVAHQAGQRVVSLPSLGAMGNPAPTFRRSLTSRPLSSLLGWSPSWADVVPESDMPMRYGSTHTLGAL